MKLNDLRKKYAEAQSESDLDALDNLLIQSCMTHQAKQMQQEEQLQRDKARLHELRLQQEREHSLWKRFFATGFSPVLRLATVAVVFVGGLWMSQPHSTTVLSDYQVLTQTYLAKEPPHGGQRKGANTLVEAKNAYQAEQYAEAAVLFKTAIESGEADETGYFYGAMSYLYQKKPNYQKVIEYLSHLKTHGKGYETDHILWYLSLTYVQIGQLHDAQMNLEALIARGFFNVEDAKQLLASLKKVEKK